MGAGDQSGKIRAVDAVNPSAVGVACLLDIARGFPNNAARPALPGTAIRPVVKSRPECR